MDSSRLEIQLKWMRMGTSADIMKVGGYKLPALEIESVLLEHPIISECAVLGFPDKDYGEAVCAIIVPQEDAKNIEHKESKPVLKLDEIETWCKEKLAAYKIPTRFFIWDTLPRKAMGKFFQIAALLDTGTSRQSFAFLMFAA